LIKIIMIEDDAELASILIEYLKDYNIEIDNFEDPYNGLGMLSIKEYDLLILDLTLPGMDGLEVCKEVVSKYDIPIIISSARSSLIDKVTSLELGADDYLPKPYDPKELEVRIKAVLRRYDKKVKKRDLNDNHDNFLFVLDEDKKEIRKGKIALNLTAAEYAILSFFIKKRGFIVSREEVLNNLEKYNLDGSLAVLINRIRKKIEEDPKNPKYLQTIRGMGYKFCD